MHASFNETNSYISSIIEDAHISGSGDSDRIDSTISISDPTSRNSDPTSSEQTPDEQKLETSDLFRSSNISYLELPKSWKTVKDHPTGLIISGVSRGVKTHSQALNEFSHLVFLSHIEPRNINEALNDEFWFLKQDGLNNFDRNNVWDLVPRPKDCSVIGTKWVFL